MSRPAIRVPQAVALFLTALALFPQSAGAVLKITWNNATHKTSFQNELTTAAGKNVTIDANGYVTVADPPPADNDFATRLRTICDDADTTTVGVDRNATNVLVGAYSTSVIDLDDKEEFTGDGQDGLPTEAGGIIHELWEQYQKQVNNKNYTDAHAAATDVENEIMGGTERACGTTAVRTEGGKTVYYIPFKKGNGTAGFVRLVLNGSQIDSISFVNAVPPPSPPQVVAGSSSAVDMSYVNSTLCPSSPIPTLGEYAMLLLVLLLLGAGAAMVYRARAQGAAA